MLERYTLIGLVFSVFITVLDFYLLKERRIRGKAFVFWLIAGAVLGLFSLVPTLVSVSDLIFGTQFTESDILATVFMFFLLALFYFHYRINELQSMVTKLAMEMSVRRYAEKSDPKNINTKPRKNNSHEDK